MEALLIAAGAFLLLILLDILAVAFGADTRDGFTEEQHVGLTV